MTRIDVIISRRWQTNVQHPLVIYLNVIQSIWAGHSRSNVATACDTAAKLRVTNTWQMWNMWNIKKPLRPRVILQAWNIPRSNIDQIIEAHQATWNIKVITPYHTNSNPKLRNDPMHRDLGWNRIPQPLDAELIQRPPAKRRDRCGVPPNAKKSVWDWDDLPQKPPVVWDTSRLQDT